MDESASDWHRACQTHLVGSCAVTVPLRSHANVFRNDQEQGPSRMPIEDSVLIRATKSNCWWRGSHLVGPVLGAGPLGLAVDLGTTYIAAALVDMITGDVVATGTVENPQLVFSGDVIGRLTLAVTNPNLAQQMQFCATKAVANLAEQLTDGCTESIAEIALVGNSVMQHLFLGLPLSTLAKAPYRPQTCASVDVLASSLGLPAAPGTWLHFGPNIAGFIGSDHVSALLDVMVDPPQTPWMLMDIGTNTEISICTGEDILSASCASGPAFEGGMLSSGMRATDGAIASVRIDREELELTTIGKAEPLGICGSGVISLVSELVRGGVVNQRGRLQITHPLVSNGLRQLEMILAKSSQSCALPVTFTQSDVRAIQLAKAAIRTAMDLLMESKGLSANQLSRLVLAGAFGRHIDVQAAKTIGLLPHIESCRIVQVGNAAGAGVRRMLVCKQARMRADELARRAKNFELATHPRFHQVFARNAQFYEADRHAVWDAEVSSIQGK